jgi:hypothetical protein
MKKMRHAIIGLGSLGRKCAEAIFSDQATTLAGIVQGTLTSSSVARCCSLLIIKPLLLSPLAFIMLYTETGFYVKFDAILP